MKVVALCNKLTRSRTLLKDGAAGFGVVTDPIEMLPKSVVSNMTTGKKLSREVRNFFQNPDMLYVFIFALILNNEHFF